MKHVDFEGTGHLPLHCDECWADSLQVREVVALETIAVTLGRLVKIAEASLDIEPTPTKPEPKPYRQDPSAPTVQIHRTGL